MHAPAVVVHSRNDGDDVVLRHHDDGVSTVAGHVPRGHATGGGAVVAAPEEIPVVLLRIHVPAHAQGLVDPVLRKNAPSLPSTFREHEEGQLREVAATEAKPPPVITSPVGERDHSALLMPSGARIRRSM